MLNPSHRGGVFSLPLFVGTLVAGILIFSNHVSAQSLVISEFMASNSTGLKDADGDEEDWIEIYNQGTQPINLRGWHLTDDAMNLTKWDFPGVVLNPGAYLVVFASNKDRAHPEEELHTNFRLSTSGEYLAIVRPDGTSVENDFGPTYPQQVTDVSYGLKQEADPIVLLGPNNPASYLVPSNGDDDVKDGVNLASWITTDFDDSSWTAGATGHGFESGASGPFEPLIVTDLEADMFTNNSSVYIRIPFEVADASSLSGLSLSMNYDDGFVAYLNGDPLAIAEANSPSSNELDFESIATSSNADSAAIVDEVFPLGTSLLNVGTNVLCIHGLNRSKNSSDALFVAKLNASVITGSTVVAYFTTATPGDANVEGASVPGPLIRTVTSGLAPLDLSAGDLVIEADVVETLNPIDSVSLQWRVMYGSEATIVMLDDGQGADSVSGDGVFTAVIPTGGLEAGEMLRWKVTASDTTDADSQSPPFSDPLDSPQYYGTIAEDPSVDSSNLPVLHWFTANPSGATTTSGSRGSVYYQGEFYDNIQADRHGQSTGGFPKKSYDFDFNKGARFLPYEDGKRAKDINLITNWADKSKTRNTIGYEIMRMAGHPAHYSFPVRVQQNGAFFSTADLVEDGDDRYLDRVGLDEDGALYKMYNRLDSSSSGVNKKTRKDENNSDLAALVSGLGQNGDARLRYGYDNMNVAGTINYLAALDMTNNRDHGHKNYYVYRDTEGTGEWRPLVWDIDLCLGRNWVSGPAYFDDVLRNNDLRAGPTNRMKQFIFNDAVLNRMFLRRVRTLMDEMLGSPAAPVDYLQNRVNDLVALIDPNDDSPTTGLDDADLDYQKWGSWGNRNAMRPAADRILNEFIPTRRTQLYGIGEIPSIQAPMTSINIGTIDFNPASSGATADQSGEYFELTNPNNTEVDCSDWVISGGISMTLPPGAVIPRNGTLHVSREAVGFRSRSVSPKGNEKRYLVSGYGGQLSARGETIVLTDNLGSVIDTKMYPGSPTSAQTGLRISELLYAPADPSAGELNIDPNLSGSDFEFIELINIGTTTLNLGGVQFVEGVSMTFAAGVMITPGQRVVVVSNQAAFELRNGIGLPVVGEFDGNLSNGGEQLQIIDEMGENVLEFTYEDDWYPLADGAGYSLVILDPAATPVTDFDQAANWRVSQSIGGSPGTASSGMPLTYQLWKSDQFTEAELGDPLVTGDQIDLDDDSMGTLLEYAFGMDPRVADDIPGYVISRQTVEEVEYQAITFRRQKSAIDLAYLVETSDDLQSWSVQTILVGSPSDNGDGTESVTIRDSTSLVASPRRFMRLVVRIIAK
jgi:hypothetical protein